MDVYLFEYNFKVNWEYKKKNTSLWGQNVMLFKTLKNSDQKFGW